MNTNNPIILSQKETLLNSEFNKSVIVLNNTETDKLSSYILPNLLQMNSSYIANVHQSEVDNLRSCFLKNDYDVKILNLSNPEQNTNQYNPFAYIGSYVTTDTDYEFEQDVEDLVKIILRNTEEQTIGEDEFWNTCKNSLFISCIFLMLALYPEHKCSLKTLSEILANNLFYLQFDFLEKWISGDIKDGDIPFNAIINECPTERQRVLGELAIKHYNIFKNHTNNTSVIDTVLCSSHSLLKDLSLSKTCTLMSCDNLEIDKIDEKPTVLLVVLNDNDNELNGNWLATMLYTQSLHLLQRKARNEQSHKLKYPVHFIIDDVSKLGSIPNFPLLLLTAKSRNISTSLCLQSLKELETLYGKNNLDMLLIGFPTWLVMGAYQDFEDITSRLKLYAHDLINLTKLGKNDCLIINTDYPFTNNVVVSKMFDLQTHSKYNELRGNTTDDER